MSYLPIHQEQIDRALEIAMELRIGSIEVERALANGSIKKFLQSLVVTIDTEYVPLSDTRIKELSKLAENHRARIHVLRRVIVDQGRDWNTAIDRGGPDTIRSSIVRNQETALRYLPVSEKIIETDIALLCYFKRCGSLDTAMNWAFQANLIVCNPREIFAAAEQNPDLNMTIGQRPMRVVAPKVSASKNDSMCGVLWQDSRRHVCECKAENIHGSLACWYGFRE